MAEALGKTTPRVGLFLLSEPAAQEPEAMFSHVMVGANDLSKMVVFYDAVLGALGLVRDDRRSLAHPAGVIWQHPDHRWPQFALRKPFNNEPANSGNGVQISFAAQSEEIVRTVWQIAVSQGGADEGSPGFRPQYSEDFYAAYCRDLEGNKLCFVHAGGLA
jgi:catechol 2,3-dioxygenase-like lactoylglutathione lyase family enzyme